MYFCRLVLDEEQCSGMLVCTWHFTKPMNNFWWLVGRWFSIFEVYSSFSRVSFGFFLCLQKVFEELQKDSFILVQTKRKPHSKCHRFLLHVDHTWKAYWMRRNWCTGLFISHQPQINPWFKTMLNYMASSKNPYNLLVRGIM